MGRLKVLLVDDSAIYRKSIRSALEVADWIEIAGTAENGRVALEKMAEIGPDLLILDMEMPEMSGLETLKEMKRRNIKCPTLVFSSISKKGAEITLEALSLGARDFVTKPGNEDDGDGKSPVERIRSLLIPKLEELFATYLWKTRNNAAPTEPTEAFPKINWSLLNPQIVVIGSSTGGPTVLEKIFSNIVWPLSCPVVLAQHMPPIFTASFAERLSKISGTRVTEARHGEFLEKNHVYIVPGDYHLRLQGTRSQTRILLDQGPQIHSVRPAVDPVFQTAAEIFGAGCLGIVLTGMGYDGRDGAAAIKRRGGAVVIQNKESCVVFGMPGAVHGAGAFDRIASPEEIALLMSEKVGALTLKARSS